MIYGGDWRVNVFSVGNGNKARNKVIMLRNNLLLHTEALTPICSVLQKLADALAKI